MTSTVRSLMPQHPIIEVTHAGTVTAGDLRASGGEAVRLAGEMGTFHVLTDCTDLTDAPDDIALLSLGEVLRSVASDKGFRQALLWPKDAQARLAVDFWRTAESDLGVQAKLFVSREAAIEWLLA